MLGALDDCKYWTCNRTSDDRRPVQPSRIVFRFRNHASHCRLNCRLSRKPYQHIRKSRKVSFFVLSVAHPTPPSSTRWWKVRYSIIETKRSLQTVEKLGAAMLHQLPEETAVLILSLLSKRDLLQAALVSKSWKRLCNDESLVSSRCLRTVG